MAGLDGRRAGAGDPEWDTPDELPFTVLQKVVVAPRNSPACGDNREAGSFAGEGDNFPTKPTLVDSRQMCG